MGVDTTLLVQDDQAVIAVDCEEAKQLRCMCNDGSWGEVEASLDVSGCVDGGIIENQNGQLNCVGPSVVGRCVHSLQRATESGRPDGPFCCLSLTACAGLRAGRWGGC